MNEDIQLTPEEEQELAEALGGTGMPRQPEKEGMFGFFNKIFKTKNTTKVSNLDEQELHAVRSIQSGSIYAKEMGMDLIGQYMDKEAEVLLGTADSKGGFLIQAAITSKRQLESQTKMTGGKKKGWLGQQKKD